MKVKEIRALSAAEMDEKVVSLKEELFNTGFISSKSKNGKDLKALELPGLWNGATTTVQSFSDMTNSAVTMLNTTTEFLQETSIGPKASKLSSIATIRS